MYWTNLNTLISGKGSPLVSPAESLEQVNVNPFTEKDAEDIFNPFANDDEHEDRCSHSEPLVSEHVDQSVEQNNPFDEESAVDEATSNNNLLGSWTELEVSRNDTIRERFPNPMTIEQLNTQFNPLGLQAFTELVDQFIVSKGNAEQSELWTLVLEHYNSRNEYVKTWGKLQDVKSTVETFTKSFWIFSTKVLKNVQTCRDGRNVTLEHEYEYADFSETSFKAFNDLWETMKMTLTVKLSRAKFENQLTWVKIEKYLNKFLVSFVGFERPDLNSNNATFRFAPHHSKAVTEMHQVLNVLFTFLRKPRPDDRFISEIIRWIHKCSAVFLRCATLFDHIMILNNALRLPASIYVDEIFMLVHLPQFSSISNQVSESTVVSLDHTLLISKIMMSGVPQRSVFLKELEKTPDVGMNADNDGKCNWILLDDSGEESECPDANWHLFDESNILGFIERLPFEKILSNLSAVMNNKTIFLQSIAYFNHLLIPFGDCFETYNLDRYALLRKRVASYCVALTNFSINSYLVKFSEHDEYNSDEHKILKLEVEALLLRSFSLLARNMNDKSVYPAIQNFNFAFLSPNSAWKLTYILIGPQDCVNVEELLQYDTDPKDLFLDGLNSFGGLDYKLQNCFFVSGAALLSTLSNMIIDGSFSDQELMIVVMNALFYISYISPQHKENYFKFGHNLISCLLTSHLELVTFYLNKINRNWEKMLSDINMSFLLEVSLDQWVPTASDIELLLHWLEFYDIQHSLNILARKILSYIDWLLVDESGSPTIPTDQQNRVLNTILHIYSTVVIKSEVHDVPFEVKCAKDFESSPTGFTNPVQNFAAWCWKMVTIMQVKGNVLAMKDEELKSETKITQNGHYLIMFAALLSSDSSKHVFSLSNGGLNMLKQLTMGGFIKPVVHVLDSKLKFELSNLDVLFLQKGCFAEILANICQGDSSISHKMGIVVQAGANTLLLSAMLVSLLQSVESSNKLHSKYLMEFLLSVILSYPNFASNYYLLYILEQLCYFSFTSKSLSECVRITFLRHLEELQKHDHSKTFRIFATHKYFTTLHCFKTYAEFGFVSYFSLVAQINFEDQNGVWSPLIEKMQDSVQNTPGAFLKDLRLDDKWSSCTFSETSLSIYLIVDVLMLIDCSHPAFPLIAQLFFARYFFRPGLSARDLTPNSSNSVGERFFASYYYMGTIKKLKLRFEEAAKVRRKPEVEPNDGDEENPTNDMDAVMLGSSSYDLKVQSGKEGISKHLDAFYLWADEPRLHTTTVVFENLPANYLPQSIIDVITRGTKPLDLFASEIQTDDVVINCMKIWHDELYSYLKKPVVIVENFDFSVEASKFRVERAKSKFVYHHRDLPEVKPSEIPLSSVDSQLLISNRSLLEYFGKSFNELTAYAQKQVALWKELNSDFDKFSKLTPQQYENKVTTLQKVVNCESLLQRQRCTGPVVFDLTYNCKSENLAVSFELDRIWKKIMESVSTSPECPLESVNAVEIMEEIVHGLIELAESQNNTTVDQRTSTKGVVENNGIDLFFLIANILSEDVMSYPPFRKMTEILFTLLGTKFIATSGDSQTQLLDLLLTKPFLVESLNSYFCPELAHGKFCAFYQKLSVRIIANFDKAHSELLLTKFDFASWLSKTSNAGLRSTVLGCVFDLLHFIGKDVTEDLEWTFTSASGHAFLFLNDNFVLEFPSFFLSMLKLSLAGKASPQLWENLAEFCGLKNFSLSIESPQLTGNHFDNCHKSLELISMFSSSEFVSNIAYFIQQTRITNWDNPPVKLFGPDIEHVSKFLIFLSKLIISCGHFQCSNGQVSKSDLSLKIWNQLAQLFSPFIAPLIHDDRLQLPKPTVESGNGSDGGIDKGFDQLCLAFTVSILEALKQDDSYSEGDFSLPSYLHHFLMHFNEVLTPSNKSNAIMNHYFNSFLNLPWSSFLPHIQSVDILLAIRQQPNINPKDFAVQIFLSIDWKRYCDLHAKMHTDVASTALHRFLLLSVLLETDDAFTEESGALVVGKLDKIRNINWTKLSPEYLTIVLSLFLKFYFKKQSLSLRNPFGSFRLLMEASGFAVKPTDDFETVSRDSSFDHKMTFMDLVSTKIQKVTSVETLSEVIESLFTYIGTNLDPMSSSASAILHLMKPIIKLINSVPFDQQTSKTLEGFSNWAFNLDNHDFLLLVIVACCQDMANKEALAYFLETACEAYFKPTTGVVRSWESISNSMELPYTGRAEFLATCSKKCFYFVLEIHLRSQYISDEEFLNLIFTWLNDSKALTAENEVKAFLLFTRCFEKLEKLMFASNAMKFIELARTFMTYLGDLSEDRETGGLRGMIGLGAASKLSQAFRICCKCISCFLQLQIESLLADPNKDTNMDSSLNKSSKKDQSAQSMLKSLKQYTVIKDYPHIAAKLQVILNSNLVEGISMDNWKELMFNLVSSFYTEEYGLKVLTN